MEIPKNAHNFDLSTSRDDNERKTLKGRLHNFCYKKFWGNLGKFLKAEFPLGLFTKVSVHN